MMVCDAALLWRFSADKIPKAEGFPNASQNCSISTPTPLFEDTAQQGLQPSFFSTIGDDHMGCCVPCARSLK
jgi:hypothetical protein